MAKKKRRVIKGNGWIAYPSPDGYRVKTTSGVAVGRVRKLKSIGTWECRGPGNHGLEDHRFGTLKAAAGHLKKRFGPRQGGLFSNPAKGNLKIKKPHYDKLYRAIKLLLDRYPTAADDYKKQGLSAERFRWDCVYAAMQRGDIPKTFLTKTLYPYINDTHIDSALKRIMEQLGHGKVAKNPSRKQRLMSADERAEDNYDKVFGRAMAHARACRKCYVPIIDSEGNPGYFSEACPAGYKILKQLVDAEQAYMRLRGY